MSVAYPIGGYLAGLAVGVALMSLLEYAIHRWQMHRPGFLNRVFPGTFEEHHHEHHGRYYRRFDHEPDERGRRLNLTISYVHFCYGVLPALLVLGACGPWAPPAGVATAILGHHLAWNAFHCEMHDPRGRFFSRWPWYKALCRHHYLHHRHVNRNFNVVFPFCDRPFGTLAVATPAEVAEMKNLGYLP